MDQKTLNRLQDGVQYTVRTPYNFDRNAWSEATGVTFTGKDRTKQEFKEECDINNIVAKFMQTGQAPIMDVRTPIDADFIEVTTFHEALNHIQQAEDAFMQLPATVRERFKNDPGNMVEFLSDDNNWEEAASLGLAAPAPKPPAPPAPTGAPAAPAPPGQA